MSSDLLHTLFSNVWSIFLVVLFFGGSIFVHELGHFLAARWRGVHVERFSIGFGPPIISWRGRDGVEYRIAWFPLGGYVLLPQLADLGPIEGKSEVDAAKLPSVGYVSRMLVFVAGAAFNLLFAFALATIVWIVGEPESSDTATTRIGYITRTVELPDGQVVRSPASEAGLQVNDTIRAIDGNEVENWIDVKYMIGLGAGQTEDGRREAIFTVERGGRVIDVTVNPRLLGEERERIVGISPAYELIVHEVTPRTPAALAGFQRGDEILRIGDTPILGANSYFEQLEHTAAAPVSARVKRGDREMTLTIPAHPDAKNAANFGLALTTGFQLTHPSPFAQVADNVTMTFRTLWSLLNPHSDIGLSKMSGAIGIVRIFHSAAEAGIGIVMIFAILVNVNLAIFNLLPLPILDGGQMLFATIGKIRGRALPPNFIIAAQSTFGVLLLAVMLYLSVFDVRRWARDVQAEHTQDTEAAAHGATAPAPP